jgi:hypothetical protein
MYQHPAILVLMIRTRSLVRKEIQSGNVLKCLEDIVVCQKEEEDIVVKPLNGNIY